MSTRARLAYESFILGFLRLTAMMMTVMTYSFSKGRTGKSLWPFPFHVIVRE